MKVLIGVMGCERDSANGTLSVVPAGGASAGGGSALSEYADCRGVYPAVVRRSAPSQTENCGPLEGWLGPQVNHSGPGRVAGLFVPAGSGV